MAAATGREVLTVARESFALTLYTFWHLEQRRRLNQILQRAERFDLAGLMAYAVNQPKELSTQHAKFLASLRPASSPSSPPSGLTPRQLETIRAAHRAAHIQTLALS